MQRFNLVIHGMMLLVDGEDDFVDILIPEVDPHDYQHGRPHGRPPQVQDLRAIYRGTKWEVTGPKPGQTPLCQLISSDDMVLLDPEKVSVSDQPVFAKYRVPRPDVVRHYRASEVTQTMLEGMNLAGAKGAPKRLHEIVVLSYLHVGDHVDIIDITGRRSELLRRLDDTMAESWGIYAEPAVLPEFMEHPTTNMDNLLVDKAGDPQKLNLSHPDAIDGPLEPHSVIGLDKTMLLTLYELNNPNVGENGGSTGCSSCARCRKRK